MSDSTEKGSVVELSNKLKELESLLDNEPADTTPRKIELPVLDEVVTEADFINTEDEYDLQEVETQITQLAEKLEHKFSGELDQLVKLLKDNFKSSIVEELRQQANLDTHSKDNDDAPADTDKSV